MIAPEYLDELRRRLSIFDLVGKRVRLTRRGNQATGLCPFHNEKSPSFHVYDDDEPHYHCFGCGAHGDAIAFVMLTEDLEFLAAVEHLAADTGLADRPQNDNRSPRPSAPKMPIVVTAAEPQKAQDWSQEAECIWREIEPGESHPMLLAYFASRGIGMAPPAALGFLRSGVGASYTLPEHPRMAALVTDTITGKPTSLHFTALKIDGTGKAKIDRPKRLLFNHRKAGCVVRLTPDDAVTYGLGISEGIETGCKVLASGWSPVWATIDAGNLGAFPVLAAIQSLVIWGDRDASETGQKRSAECEARWRGAGREAVVLLPPQNGRDWADELDGGS